MNKYLFIAGAIAIILGMAHSILGEILIFRHLRKFDEIANIRNLNLKNRHFRTLWSTWHLVTLFGWGLGAILLMMSIQKFTENDYSAVITVISNTFLISSIFWAFGTKGKHPAWIVLAGIAAFAWWAPNA
ncbi:MAG: hypothetical protein AB2689_03085 [Candidatus Thiodiazotropha taylori]